MFLGYKSRSSVPCAIWSLMDVLLFILRERLSWMRSWGCRWEKSHDPSSPFFYVPSLWPSWFIHIFFYHCSRPFSLVTGCFSSELHVIVFSVPRSGPFLTKSPSSILFSIHLCGKPLTHNPPFSFHPLNPRICSFIFLLRKGGSWAVVK